MGNIVAIVGRPNVGKSTLFNRLTESRQAIVDETAGVTRDRHYGKADWNGIEFSVIDTGGYVVNSDDIFEEEIRKQVDLAIHEADVILFMVDVTGGITDLDLAIARMLRKIKKKVLLVTNKVDNQNRILEANEFYALGDTLYNISAISGFGTGDLLDAVVTNFKPEKDTLEENIPKFAIVGRPNVGKSSLLNSLLDEERNIVTPIAGTTRDSIHIRYQKFGHDFFLIDTAGLRKKGKVTNDIEFYSVMRSVRSIEHADVCLLMIDATTGIEAQDLNIIRLIQRNHKGLVILVNKWDLVEKTEKTLDIFKKNISQRIEPFTDVPILFISAIEKQRIFKTIETAMEVYNSRSLKIATSELNDKMLAIIAQTPPPSVKGKYVKIKYITQLPMHYPAFVFFANLPQYVREPYKRFLENQLRKLYHFTGVPVEIFIREK